MVTLSPAPQRSVRWLGSDLRPPLLLLLLWTPASVRGAVRGDGGWFAVAVVLLLAVALAAARRPTVIATPTALVVSPLVGRRTALPWQSIQSVCGVPRGGGAGVEVHTEDGRVHRLRAPVLAFWPGDPRRFDRDLRRLHELWAARRGDDWRPRAPARPQLPVTVRWHTHAVERLLWCLLVAALLCWGAMWWAIDYLPALQPWTFPLTLLVLGAYAVVWRIGVALMPEGLTVRWPRGRRRALPWPAIRGFVRVADGRRLRLAAVTGDGTQHPLPAPETRADSPRGRAEFDIDAATLERWWREHGGATPAG